MASRRPPIGRHRIDTMYCCRDEFRPAFRSADFLVATFQSGGYSMCPRPERAISEFLRMARVDAKDPNEYAPPYAQRTTARPLRIPTVSDRPARARSCCRAGRRPGPRALQDDGHTHNRTHRASGPQDYDPIGPAHLLHTRDAAQSRLRPSRAERISKVVYIVRTAPTNTSWFCWKSQPEVRGSVSAPLSNHEG